MGYFNVKRNGIKEISQIIMEMTNKFPKLMTANEKGHKMTKKDSTLQALQMKTYSPHVAFKCTKATTKILLKLTIDRKTDLQKEEDKDHCLLLRNRKTITWNIYSWDGERGEGGSKGGREKEKEGGGKYASKAKQGKALDTQKIDVHCNRPVLQALSRDSPQAEKNSIDYKLLKMYLVNLEQSLFLT